MDLSSNLSEFFIPSNRLYEVRLICRSLNNVLKFVLIFGLKKQCELGHSDPNGLR